MKASTSSLRQLLNRLLAQIDRLVLPRSAMLAPEQARAAGPAHRVPPGQAPARSQATPAAPAGAAPRDRAKTMRSPEEVRTDLARLRANSRQRHAPVPIERPTTFDDSVFANFTEAASRANADADYSKTVCVPRPASRPQLRKVK